MGIIEANMNIEGHGVITQVAHDRPLFTEHDQSHCVVAGDTTPDDTDCCVDACKEVLDQDGAGLHHEEWSECSEWGVAGQLVPAAQKHETGTKEIPETGQSISEYHSTKETEREKVFSREKHYYTMVVC